MTPVVQVLAEDAVAVDVVGVMSTTFQKIVTDTVSMLGAIAPIAVSIFAIFFLWNQGKKFFKSMSNN